VVTATSVTARPVEIVANRKPTKNAIAQNGPAGICGKTCGSVTKVSCEPSEGSRPKANTSGKTAKIASNPTEVLPTAVKRPAPSGTSSFFER